MLMPELCARAFTTAPELIARASHDMRIQFLAFPIIGFQIVTTNFFQCIGMPSKSIFLSLSRQLIFLLPPLLLLPHIIGSDGVWWSMPISDTLATFTTAYLFYRQMRKFKMLEAKR
jgi:Na+-driven multidrug efflux pump